MRNSRGGNKNRNKWEEEVVHERRDVDVIRFERGNLITMHYMLYIEQKSDK